MPIEGDFEFVPATGTPQPGGIGYGCSPGESGMLPERPGPVIDPDSGLARAMRLEDGPPAPGPIREALRGDREADDALREAEELAADIERRRGGRRGGSDRERLDDIRAGNRQLAQGLGLPIAEEMAPPERTPNRRAVSLTYGLGAWEDVGPGKPLVFIVAGGGTADEAHRLSTLVGELPGAEAALEAALPGEPRPPQFEPQRVELARAKAEGLGLPFTPDMTMAEVEDGTRAVDGMGRVGAFHSQPGRSSGEEYERLLFVPDSRTPSQVIRELAETLGIPAPARTGVEEPALFVKPSWPRNGREVGAWAAGLALEHPQLHLALPRQDVAGAVTSLVDAGMQVQRHGSSQDGEIVTLDVVCPEGLGDDGRPRGPSGSPMPRQPRPTPHAPAETAEASS